MGGVGIYVAFIATLALIYPFANHMFWFLIGCTLLLFIGLIDDFAVLKPHQKFLGQCIAVLCFLKGGFSLRTHFFTDWLTTGISAFWMLSVINAFNLVDVMDGLSTTLALCAAATFFIVSLLLGQYAIGLLLLAFIGSLTAFLWYNKPPARIYLGDAGSMFVGGFLAAMPLLFSWSTLHLQGYIVPAIILGVPLLEITTLVVVRSMKGIPFYKGSPDHFSIYLRNKKWSTERVLIFSAFSSVALSAGALLFLTGGISLISLVLYLFCFGAVWLYFIFSGKSFYGARVIREEMPSEIVIIGKKEQTQFKSKQ